MRVLLQRVQNASVSVDGKTVGAIEQGYLAFVGIGGEDTEETVKKMLDKIYKLRIFADENGKTNLAAKDVGAELLAVSQFTLYADCSHGNRPSFMGAAPPAEASRLFDYFADQATALFSKVERGIFGADMQVSLTNDGPFTIWLEM
ncbi:MAG: D-tyrosyl-tRNA(Tyr) deacylase [Clostridia bacterium]|nr:D-tyrosyl-tRNA(Tyr) deacylase [Clostridia bacterium]